MAKLLIIHSSRSARKFLSSRAGVHHTVKVMEDVLSGMKAIPPFRPDVLIMEMDPRNMQAMDLLRRLKEKRIKTPVILVGPAGAGVLAPMAKKLGANEFVEYPMEQDTFDQVIANALQTDQEETGDLPAITEEERNANLSELEKSLNRHMVCVAGKNQVYIQSLIISAGRTSKPRIALKCPLRKQFGYRPDVYYEYIRDVCCSDPSGCAAYQEFAARNTA